MSKHGKHKLTKEKAREILKHGTVRGHPLTERQRGLFGAIISGARLRYKKKK